MGVNFIKKCQILVISKILKNQITVANNNKLNIITLDTQILQSRQVKEKYYLMKSNLFD